MTESPFLVIPSLDFHDDLRDPVLLEVVPPHPSSRPCARSPDLAVLLRSQGLDRIAPDAPLDLRGAVLLVEGEVAG